MRALGLTRLPIGAVVGMFAVLGLGPLLLLSYLSVSRASDAVTAEVTARARATAVASADLVQRELLGLSQLVDAYARRRTLVDALGNGNPARYRRSDIAFDLSQLRRSRPGIAVVFVTDPSGRAVDIIPSTPSIIGDDFSFRDWYRGVTDTRRPYVSEAYRTVAAGRAAVVAAAALVRGPSARGEARTLGILVAAYDLAYIQSFVERFAETQGVRLTVTDQAGALVAAPGAPQRLVSVRRDPLVAAALRGESGVVTRDGLGGRELAAYVPVPRLGWTVTAGVSRDAAFASVGTLRSTVATITALLAFIFFAGLALLAWTLSRRARAERHAEALYRFGERLVAETEIAPLAETILEHTADYARADAGALYVLDPELGEAHSLTATRGLDRARLAQTVAVGEGLRLAGLAEEIPTLHELHVPLVHAGRPVGALVLGRAGERAFSPGEVGDLGHLADQAAVALANALNLRLARRLADVNRAVLDATVDGVTMLDVEGNVALMNEAQRRLLVGVFALPTDGDLPASVLGLAQRTTDPAGFLAAIEARRTDPEAEIEDEFTLLDPPRTFERFSAPVRGGDGSELGRIVVLRDVTAQRAVDQFKADLIATVAHELRTPLTSILGFSELLASQDVDAATRTRYLEIIHGEATRLTDLVNQFLSVERFASGRVELAREAFSLAEVLRTAAELFAGQSAAHTLELEPTDGPLEARGDRDRTAQVVANLLSNAIKYSPAGGTITIAAARNGEVVRVSITDRGLGIPAEQQQRVFEKFFRADSTATREIGGTGLGLALSKDIVEAQGGRIGFESAQGVGSTFWFELPAA